MIFGNFLPYADLYVSSFYYILDIFEQLKQYLQFSYELFRQYSKNLEFIF